jgi:hypothetical protein
VAIPGRKKSDQRIRKVREHVIDLEDLANRQGSAFGNIDCQSADAGNV